VHPESTFVEKMASDLGVSVKELMINEICRKLDQKKYISEKAA